MKISPFPGELTTQLVEHPFITKTGKQGCQRNYTIVLTDEQREWLCRYYPEVEGPVLMQLSGMSHGTRNERSAAKRGRQVEQLTLDGHHVAFYQSASEASRMTGIGRKNINECLCLRSQTAGGYHWKYKE